MLGLKMTANLLSNSLFQIMVLTFTLQELQANPLYIPQNNHTTNNFKLGSYIHLNDAKILRKDLTNITTSVDNLIKQLDYWVFAEISNITNSNSSVGKLQSLKDSLSILELNVTELSVALSKGSNIEEIARKSKSVQIYLNNLQKEFNNIGQAYSLINEYLDETNVIDKFSNLTINKSYIDLVIEDEIQTKLAEDCITAATNKNFRKAAHLLDLIKNSSKTEYIVKRLNTDVAFKLGNKIRNITISFMFYQAIYNDLITNIEDTDDKLGFITKLIKSIKEEIIDQVKTPIFIKKEAIEFNQNLSKPLEDLVKIKLEVRDFLECGEIDPNFIKEIIVADYRLASEIFYSLHKNYGLDCLFRYHYVDNTFTQSNALKFALFLKYFIDICENENDFCDPFTSFIDELPQSIRNIVFAKKVCISQGRTSMFLRLSDVSYDTIRYSAYTHEESFYVPEEIWKLIHLGNNEFIVQNIGIVDTYLDTDLHYDDKSGEHGVYGWHKPPNNGVWKFDLTENLEFFYIKNMARNEYLYISDEINNFVYTNSILNYNLDDFEWKISNCTDVKLVQ
uniref:Putative secreted protein n=1 Tax=Panstrongylus lignarius TaxID=156445 RepID=A0A224XA65_9HEMI